MYRTHRRQDRSHMLWKIALVVVAALTTLGLTLGLAGTANAQQPPGKTVRYAKQMRCYYINPNSVMSDSPNSGVSCVVKNRMGRQEFYVVQYQNIKRGVEFWKDWIGRDGYVVRKGDTMIISQGNNGVGGDWGYSYEWADYAA